MNIKIYKNKKIYCFYEKKILKKNFNIYIIGLIGIYIKNNISQLAWNKWMKHQTFIINKYKLSTNNVFDINFLILKMISFFFKK